MLIHRALSHTNKQYTFKNLKISVMVLQTGRASISWRKYWIYCLRAREKPIFLCVNAWKAKIWCVNAWITTPMGGPLSNAFQFTRVKQCSLRIGDAMSTSQNNAYRISTLFSRKMSLIITVYDTVYNVLNLWKTCQNVERTGLNLLERCTILR